MVWCWYILNTLIHPSVSFYLPGFLQKRRKGPQECSQTSSYSFWKSSLPSIALYFIFLNPVILNVLETVVQFQKNNAHDTQNHWLWERIRLAANLKWQVGLRFVNEIKSHTPVWSYFSSSVNYHTWKCAVTCWEHLFYSIGGLLMLCCISSLLTSLYKSPKTKRW